MKNSENKCRKRIMGGFDFCPEVIVYKNSRDVWNSVIRCHNGELINCVIIKRRAKASDIQRPLSTILTEAERAYKICRD